MKKNILLPILAMILIGSGRLEARQGFTVGLGPAGNIFLIDTVPILDPGFGGYVFFDYRFLEQIAFSTSFIITTQDGTNVSRGDNGILFLGMPTLDMKFFFRRGDPRFDPFVATGVGFYWVTEGSIGNSTGGVGLGAQVGVGFDYYFSQQISAGFEGVFRSVGLITNLGTPSASTALFPYSLLGNVAFHF